MALEIERKFRVSGDGWRPLVTRTRHLRQAYLSKNGRVSIRVRIDGDADGTLTIKAARSGLERHEYEYVIPLADAEELMLQREGAIISKSRHIVPIDGLNWEIDVWGKIRRGIESDRAAYLNTVASYDDALVTVNADVASTYVTIRTTEERLRVAERNADTQRESLRVASVQFKYGETSELDVRQATTLLAQTEAHECANRL